LARDIKKELGTNVYSFGHHTLILSLRYRVKCRSRSLAIDKNEFLPGSVCVGSPSPSLSAVFKYGFYSRKKFFLEHFAENHMTLWRTVPKLWCQ